MKNNWIKRLMAMLLAAMLVICLVACGDSKGKDKRDDDKSDKDKEEVTEKIDEPEELTAEALEGTWVCDLMLVDFLNMIEESEDTAFMKNIESKASIALQISFLSDGEYTIAMEKDALVDAYYEMVEDMYDYFRDGGLYDMMTEQENLSAEEVDAVLKEQGYDSIDEYIDELEASSSDSIDDTVDQMMTDMELDENGNFVSLEDAFEIDGDKLLLADDGEIDEDSYLKCELIGDELTIVKDTFGDGIFADHVFHKQ